MKSHLLYQLRYTAAIGLQKTVNQQPHTYLSRHSILARHTVQMLPILYSKVFTFILIGHNPAHLEVVAIGLRMAKPV